MFLRMLAIIPQNNARNLIFATLIKDHEPRR